MERYGRPSKVANPPISLEKQIKFNRHSGGVNEINVDNQSIGGEVNDPEDASDTPSKETKKDSFRKHYKMSQRPKSGLRRANTGIFDKAEYLRNRPNSAGSIRRKTATVEPPKPLSARENSSYNLNSSTTSPAPQSQHESIKRHANKNMSGWVEKSSAPERDQDYWGKTLSDNPADKEYIDLLKTNIRSTCTLLQKKTATKNCSKWMTCAEEISRCLNKYCYSTEFSQVLTAKCNLENMLNSCLAELMNCSLTSSTRTSSNVEEALSNSTSPLRTSLANSCFPSFLSLLRRSEELQVKINALHEESYNYGRKLKKKNKELDEVRGQMLLYKDTLAKKIDEKHGNWSRIQNEFRKALLQAKALSNEEKEQNLKEEIVMEYEGNIENLQAQIDSLRAQNEADRLNFDNSKAKIEGSLRIQLQSKDDTIEVLKRNHKFDIENLNKQHNIEVSSLNSSADGYLSEINRLKTEIINHAKISKESSESLQASCTKKIEDIKRDKLLKEKDFRKQIEIERRNQASLQAMAQTQREKQSNYELEIQALKNEIIYLQREISTQEACIALQKKELSEAKECIHVEKDTVLKHKNKLACLEAGKSILLKRIEELENKHCDITTKYTNLEFKYQEQCRLQSEKKIHDICDRASEAELELVKLKDQQKLIAEVQQANATLLGQIDVLSSEIKTLNKEISNERQCTEREKVLARQLSQELETANLCLSERRIQRKREKEEYEAREMKISQANSDLRNQIAAMQIQEGGIASKEIDNTNSLQLENDLLKKQLEDSLDENKKLTDLLMDRNATEIVTTPTKAIKSPRNSAPKSPYSKGVKSPRTPRTPKGSTIADLRVEIKKYREKIAIMEERLIDAKKMKDRQEKDRDTLILAHERKFSEDSKKLMKQKREIEKEFKLHEKRKSEFENELRKFNEDSLLLKDVISMLNVRLGLQLELLSIVPMDGNKEIQNPHYRDKNFLSVIYPDNEKYSTNDWHHIQSKWAALRDKLDDSDWKLTHMKALLNEIDDNYDCFKPNTSSRSLHGKKTGIQDVAFSPFSDAIAAGKPTIDVANQLSGPSPKDSGMLEEQQTFIAALTLEMEAMKETYEKKLSDIKEELKVMQKANLRNTNRTNSQHQAAVDKLNFTISQYKERCSMLELKLKEITSTLQCTQNEEIKVFENYYSSKKLEDEVACAQSLVNLLELRENALRDEMHLREELDARRLNKLKDSCGASSVNIGISRDAFKIEANRQ